MSDLFQAMHAQEEAYSLNQQEPQQGGVGEILAWSIQAKLVRLGFPRYNGVDDLTIWLCQAKQYFEFQGMVEREKVRVASYHMEGDAHVWIQRKKTLRAYMDWEEFKSKLMLHFGTTPYYDGFGELCKLK